MKKDKTDKSRILVVDDDETIGEMIVSFLARLGYDATAVGSGRDALAVFFPGRFHLVLIDLKLPDIGGLELLEEIRKRDRRVPVIIISGYGTIDATAQAIRKGAFDFLAKPLNMDEMEFAIRKGVEQYTLSLQLKHYKSLAIILSASLPLWLLLGYLLVKLF